MKKTHIFGILIIAVAMAIIVSSFGDASQYVNFGKAQEMYSAGETEKIHVVGELLKDENGEIVGLEYEPLKDANFMSFKMKDENGKIQTVLCYNPPPSMQDFKKSEKIVIIGRYEKNGFVASDILMKCPSKYEETEVKS
ncbi:MAG: cytochrome c maturation protein CcmE [Bacteroidetes bacterium]|nr:MAG: cytochrome c maturation protein CcmE [Bacteroidota bacterium]